MAQIPAPAHIQSLSGEELRVTALSDLLHRARARAPVPPQLARPSKNGGVGLTQKQTARLLAMAERSYRKIEHGGLRHPTTRFVEKLGQVLGMTQAERDLLYRLAMHRPATSTACPVSDIRSLRSTLDGMAEPTVLTDVAWNVLAWNRALAEHVQDPAAVPEQARNSILWMFSQTAPERIPGVRAEYEQLVGRVRMAYLSDYGRTSVLRELAAQLQGIPEAAEYWNAGALALDPTSTPRLLASPATGTGRVNTFSTRLPGQGLRLIVSVPETATP